jgi:RNA polymerase sigma factor (sigma-70 family)
MTTDSDEILMGALAAGEDAALNPLMDRWQGPLRRFLYRHTQNEHDALDLAQETFVRIYQHRARFRTGARFSTWMFQIALNLARSRGRWLKRHPTDPLESGSETPNAKVQLSTEASPADRAVAAERVTAVRSAIAALPRELREAVLLFEYEDKSHAEIAAIVRATPKAVETRLYRARQQLRKALTRYLV